MLFSRVVHVLLLFESVLLSRVVEIAVVVRASSSDEDLSSGESTGRRVILNIPIVNGSETISIRKRTES